MYSHGGNIKEAARNYGLKEDSFIDFSTSINPLGLPDKLKKIISSSLDTLPRYPDPNCAELKDKFSRHLKIPSHTLLFGNGSIELIFLIASALKIKKALIPIPTFSEYEKAVKSAGGKCLFIKMSDSRGFKIEVDKIVKNIRNAGLLFICNPNNPTGYLLNKDELGYISRACAKNGAVMAIDEVFLDFVQKKENISMLDTAVKTKHILILRSLTKFFALAGLRLGYLAGEKSLIKQISCLQPPWSVNSLAQIAGAAVIEDTNFIQESRQYVFHQREKLFNELKKIKYLRLYPPAANFIFCKIENAKLNSGKLRDYCARAGILIRDCGNFRGLNNKFVRLAVKKEEENNRLVKILARYND